VADAPRDTPVPGALAVVKSTHVAPGRPRIRVTTELPLETTPEAAVRAARARARLDPSHRFQAVQLGPGSSQPKVLWDSHAPS
jgi:hypothetical protein